VWVILVGRFRILLTMGPTATHVVGIRIFSLYTANEELGIRTDGIRVGHAADVVGRLARGGCCVAMMRDSASTANHCQPWLCPHKLCPCLFDRDRLSRSVSHLFGAVGVLPQSATGVNLLHTVPHPSAVLYPGPRRALAKLRMRCLTSGFVRLSVLRRLGWGS